MYLGYRFLKRDGQHHQPDILETDMEAAEYIAKYIFRYPEIRITNHDDEIVAWTVDGNIITEENEEHFRKQWNNFKQLMKQSFLEDI